MFSTPMYTVNEYLIKNYPRAKYSRYLKIKKSKTSEDIQISKDLKRFKELKIQRSNRSKVSRDLKFQEI